MSINDFMRNRFDYTHKLLVIKRKINSSQQHGILYKIRMLKFFLYNYKLGSSIAYNTVFSSDPYFPHGARGVFISGGGIIGKGAVIFQHVTIGSNSLPDSKSYGCPHIGDNCYIGAGAIIIGKVVIGNNVRIGAGAIVCKDVPDNTVVVSQPVRMITKDNMDNTFYSYKDGNLVSH